MRCLIVLAKAPQPGRVKTRLCPPLSQAAAAALSKAFLLDSLAQYARLPVAVRLYLAGTWTFGSEQLGGASLHRQGSGTLADRLAHACADSQSLGYRRIVVIGTDHPTLPSMWITDAFTRLEETSSAVIGPATDGGFYLLGMHPYAPAAFDGQLSHDKVFEETYTRLVRRWEQVHTLPEWYDVDRPADLERLKSDGRMREHCPNTYSFLTQCR